MMKKTEAILLVCSIGFFAVSAAVFGKHTGREDRKAEENTGTVIKVERTSDCAAPSIGRTSDCAAPSIGRTSDYAAPSIGRTFCNGTYEYKVLKDGTAMLSGYHGKERKLRIPEELDGYRISVIGTKSFYRAASIETVIIPGSVERICEGAFQCERLKTVIVEEGVKRLESKSFFACRNIIKMILPESITYIGMFVFPSDSGIRYFHVVKYHMFVPAKR